MYILLTVATIPPIGGVQDTIRSILSEEYEHKLKAIEAASLAVLQMEEERKVVTTDVTPGNDPVILKKIEFDYKSCRMEIMVIDKAAAMKRLEDMVLGSNVSRPYSVISQLKKISENCPIVDIPGTVFVDKQQNKYKPTAIFRRPVALEFENSVCDTGDVFEIEYEFYEHYKDGEYYTPVTCALDFDKVPAELLAWTYLQTL